MSNDSLDDLRDDLRRSAKSTLATTVLTREVNGTMLSIQVDPCAWMYPGYGLQASVTIAGGGGNATINDKSLAFSDATEKDLQRFLDQVGLVACKRCGKPAFDPATVSTNRDGACETCFMDDLNAKWAKDEATQIKKEKSREAKYRAQGFTHKVDAWIHPSRGDDYQVTMYWKGQPTKADIEAKLRAEGSQVLNDYKLSAL